MVGRFYDLIPYQSNEMLLISLMITKSDDTFCSVRMVMIIIMRNDFANFIGRNPCTFFVDKTNE